jgi:Arc/MetJ family transcription regulator
MEDEELEEIRAAAERARLTTSEWVRLVLREARGGRVAETVASDGDRVRERATPSGYSPPLRSPVLVDDRLLHQVMERYRFPTRTAAVDFALERVAEPLMTREEMLAMRGTGWSGDLDEIRSGNRPPAPRPDGPSFSPRDT